jgi:hypothetical protein
MLPNLKFKNILKLKLKRNPPPPPPPPPIRLEYNLKVKFCILKYGIMIGHTLDVYGYGA